MAIQTEETTPVKDDINIYKENDQKICVRLDETLD
jgi:hypothetical protein